MDSLYKRTQTIITYKLKKDAFLIEKEDKWKNIPAVVHVDGTCRLQTVNRTQNPLYYDLIKEFYKQTGVPLILNTSFNLAGQPIVFNPAKAVDVFLSSKLDFIYFPEIEKVVV